MNAEAESRIREMIKNAKKAATLYASDGKYPDTSVQQYTLGKAIGMELALAIMKGEIAPEKKRVRA